MVYVEANNCVKELEKSGKVGYSNIYKTIC